MTDFDISQQSLGSPDVAKLAVEVAQATIDDGDKIITPSNDKQQRSHVLNNDPYLQAAMQDPKMREYLLGMEQRFAVALNDWKDNVRPTSFLVDGPLTAREILLITRLADRFKFGCQEKNGNATVDGMSIHIDSHQARVPEKNLLDSFPTTRKSRTEHQKPKKIVLVRREKGEKPEKNANSSKLSSPVPLQKSVEQRQRDYEEAKARIFKDAKPSGSDDGSSCESSSRSGKESSSTKRGSPSGGYRRNGKDKDFQRSRFARGGRSATAPPLMHPMGDMMYDGYRQQVMYNQQGYNQFIPQQYVQYGGGAMYSGAFYPTSHGEQTYVSPHFVPQQGIAQLYQGTTYFGGQNLYCPSGSASEHGGHTTRNGYFEQNVHLQGSHRGVVEKAQVGNA